MDDSDYTQNRCEMFVILMQVPMRDVRNLSAALSLVCCSGCALASRLYWQNDPATDRPIARLALGAGLFAVWPLVRLLQLRDARRAPRSTALDNAKV